MFVPRYIQSFGPFWFMSTIFQFYLLFYGFVWIKEHSKNNAVLIAVLLVLCQFWCMVPLMAPQIPEKMGDIFGASLPLYCWWFMLGMIAAERLYCNGVLYITWGSCFSGSASFEWYMTHLVLLEILWRSIEPEGLAQELLFCLFGTVATALMAAQYHQYVQKADAKLFKKAA